MEMSWQEEQILEDFLEEDLPFLIKPHYENTLIVLKRKLQVFNSSLDIVSIQYPNFLEKIRYHLFFFFAHQINTNRTSDRSFYASYCLVATAYQNQYIETFVENQIQDCLVRGIICFSDRFNN